VLIEVQMQRFVIIYYVFNRNIVPLFKSVE